MKKLCVNLKNRSRLLKQCIENYTQHIESVKNKKKRFVRSRNIFLPPFVSIVCVFQLSMWWFVVPKISWLYFDVVNYLIARKYEWMPLSDWKLIHLYNIKRSLASLHFIWKKNVERLFFFNHRQSSRVFLTVTLTIC